MDFETAERCEFDIERIPAVSAIRLGILADNDYASKTLLISWFF
jgi:hypothetical protein